MLDGGPLLDRLDDGGLDMSALAAAVFFRCYRWDPETATELRDRERARHYPGRLLAAYVISGLIISRTWVWVPSQSYPEQSP